MLELHIPAYCHTCIMINVPCQQADKVRGHCFLQIMVPLQLLLDSRRKPGLFINGGTTQETLLPLAGYVCFGCVHVWFIDCGKCLCDVSRIVWLLRPSVCLSSQINTALIKREDNVGLSQGHSCLSPSSFCCIDFSVFLSCSCLVCNLCPSPHPSVIFWSFSLLSLTHSVLPQSPLALRKQVHFSDIRISSHLVMSAL